MRRDSQSRHAFRRRLLGRFRGAWLQELKTHFCRADANPAVQEIQHADALKPFLKNIAPTLAADSIKSPENAIDQTKLPLKIRRVKAGLVVVCKAFFFPVSYTHLRA